MIIHKEKTEKRQRKDKVGKLIMNSLFPFCAYNVIMWCIKGNFNLILHILKCNLITRTTFIEYDYIIWITCNQLVVSTQYNYVLWDNFWTMKFSSLLLEIFFFPIFHPHRFFHVYDVNYSTWKICLAMITFSVKMSLLFLIMKVQYVHTKCSDRKPSFRNQQSWFIMLENNRSPLQPQSHLCAFQRADACD